MSGLGNKRTDVFLVDFLLDFFVIAAAGVRGAAAADFHTTSSPSPSRCFWGRLLEMSPKTRRDFVPAGVLCAVNDGSLLAAVVGLLSAVAFSLLTIWLECSIVVGRLENMVPSIRCLSRATLGIKESFQRKV